MSETKFTKGPWSVGFESEMIKSEVTEKNPGSIAIVASRPPFAFGGAVALTWEMGNARLTAAAPDLYEALAGFVSDCDNDECERCIAARSALAKARGETT